MLTSHPAPWSTEWPRHPLTSAAGVPPCRFCYRHDSGFRASGPLAFQRMQKLPLQRHPGFSTVHSNMGTSQGSAVRKTHEFHFLSRSPRTSHRLQDIPRLQPPSSSSLLHLPSLPSYSHYKQLTTSLLPGCQGRKTRPEPKSSYVHSAPSLFSSSSRKVSAQPGLLWYSCWLPPASAPPQTSCPPKVLCLSALFIFKYAAFFWQDSHLSFPFLAPYLLAALSPYSSQTQINHILI